MRLFIAPFIAAAAFLACALPAATADEKSDAAKKIEGTYQLLFVSINGKPDDRKKDEVDVLVIKDGTITIKLAKDKEEVALFTLDPAKKPAHIDLSPKGEKETIKGIYEMKETDKGLELMLAFSKDGDSDRPTDFKGEGAGVTVLKMLRKKDK